MCASNRTDHPRNRHYFVSLCKVLFLSTLYMEDYKDRIFTEEVFSFLKRFNDKFNRNIMSGGEVNKKERESRCVKGKPQVFVFNLQDAEMLLHISIQV